MIRTPLNRQTKPAAETGRPRRMLRPKAASFRPSLEQFEDRLLLATRIWTGAVNENWSNAGNWNGGVPSEEDTAVFNNTATRFTSTVDAAFAGTLATLNIQSNWGGTISVNRSLSVTDGWTLAGGSFSGNGAMTLAGTSVWSGGSLGLGTGGLTNNGTLTLSVGGQINLGGGTLTNTGTILHTGGNLAFFGLTLTNTATGLYELRSDSILFNSGTVNNAGTIRKTTTTGTSAIQVAFNSSGTLDVQTGTLGIGGGGGTNTGGTFTVSESAVLDLTNGSTVAYTGTYTGSGAGLVRLQSGRLQIGTGGATFDFAAGLFQWRGGDLGIAAGSTLTNAATGEITLFGGSQKNLGDTGTLLNHGKILHADAGNLALFNGVVLNNAATGIYEVRGEAGNNQIFNSGTVTNAGTIRKTAGTGTFFFATTTFSNSGTIDVQAGTVGLASGGGISTGGTFTVALGAALDLTSGSTVTYTGTYTGTGAGTVRLQNGTLLIGTAGATFDFSAGLFQWSGGNLSLAGTLTNATTGAITLSGAGQKNLFGLGTLTNNGTILQRDAGNLALFNAVLNNAATGIYEVQGGAGNNALFNQGSVTNAGTIRKTAGTGTFIIQTSFSNSANIVVQAGTIALANSTGTSTGGTFTVAQDAVLDLTGGTTVTYTGTYTGTGAGTVRLQNGTLVIGAAGATFDFSAGLFQWSGGGLDLTGTLTNAVGSVLTISGSGQRNLGGAGPLMNRGTLIHTGGILAFFNNVVLNNTATGTYDLRGGIGDLALFNQGSVLNAGTFRKSTGTGNGFLDIPISNTGTVEVGAGTLQLRSTVTQVSGSTLTAGNWTAFANATLHITTAGNLTTSNGNVTLSGVGSNFVNINNLAVNGGTFTVTGGRTFTTVGNLTNTGALAVGDSSTLAVSGNLTNFAGNTLTGGTYRLRGTLRFTGADLRTNAADITLDGAASRIVNQTDGNALTNFATNAADGRFTLLNGRNLASGSAFTNAGTLSVGTGSTFTFTNGGDTSGSLTGAGNVLVSDGPLNVSGTYNLGGATRVTSGTVNILASAATGSLVSVGSSVVILADLTLTGDYTQSGSAVTDLQFGTLTAANVVIGEGSVLMGTGTLNGSVTNNGTLVVVVDNLMTINGTLTNFAGNTLTGGIYQISGTLQFTGADIRTNAADLTLDGPAARVVNEADADALAGFSMNDSGGRVTLQNGSALTMAVPFTNTGSLTVGAGSTFTFAAGGLSDGTIEGDGTVAFAGGTTDLLGAYTLGGATQVLGGAVNILGEALTGTLDNAGYVAIFGGLTVVGDYTQLEAGVTDLFYGTLSAANVFISAGSLLMGAGTINANVTNGGLLEVGYAGFAGILAINGDYTQTADGVLNLELGDLSAGEFDQLAISGTAILEGTLNVSLLETFLANEGDAFAILTYAARGEGDPTLALPDLGPEFYLDPLFDETGLTLWLTRA